MSFNVTRFRALLACVVLAGGADAISAAEPADLTLERVVLVQRHGVRAPTKPAASYNIYSDQPWPEWSVAPGQLTRHGAKTVGLVARALRHSYSKAGLLPERGCPSPGQVAVWADGGDERTRDSGQAFTDAAFPGCGLRAAHAPDGTTDPLFDAIDSGACPLDPAEAAKALADGLKMLSQRRAEIDAAKATMFEILSAPSTPNDCSFSHPACFLYGQDVARAGKTNAKLEGPLAAASSLAENLLLEYAENMKLSDVGWGRADSSRIAQIMTLHNIYAALGRRTPLIAAHNGALMARAVLNALEGKPALPSLPAATALTVIAGHDTTISNLAGIFGIDWILPGQPDATAPATALAIELWRDSKGERQVRLRVIYLTLEDMRTADDTVLPASVSVALPFCDGGSCRLADFVDHVQQTLPKDCSLP